MLLWFGAAVVVLTGFGHALLLDSGFNDGIFLAVASQWMKGLALYRDVYDVKPPGLFVLYRLGLEMGGENLLPLRSLLALIYALIVPLTAAIARRMGLPVVLATLAGIAALLMWQPWAFHDSSPLTLPPLLAGLWLLLARPTDPQTGRLEPLSPPQAVLTGVCFALALSIKHTAAFAAVPVLVIALWPAEREQRFASMMAAQWTLAGMALTAVPFVWLLIREGGFGWFWVAVVTHPLAYVGSFGLGPIETVQALLADSFDGGTLWAAGLLALPVVSLVAVADRGLRALPGIRRAVALVVAFSWGGVAAAASIGGVTLNVWAPAAPGLALLVAWGLWRLWHLPWPRQAGPRAALRLGLMGSGLALLILDPGVREAPSILSQRFAQLQADSNRPLYTQEPLLPGPGARVQMMGNLSPQILYLSSARTASNLIVPLSVYPDRLVSGAEGEALARHLQAPALATFQAHPPAVVIQQADDRYGQTLADMPGFAEHLAFYEELCPMVGGVRVYWRRDLAQALPPVPHPGLAGGSCRLPPALWEAEASADRDDSQPQ